MLIMHFLQLSSILHDLPDHTKIQSRFSPKEINFKIMPVTGIGNQKVQSCLSHFLRHERTVSLIFTFPCETITAGQVTVMGNMKTEGFHHGLPVLHFLDIIFIIILGEQETFAF